MEAIQQLSQTIKQLETFHIKQLKMKSPPQGAPPPPPSAPVVVPSAPPIEAETIETTSENPTPEPTKSEVPKTPEPSKIENSKTPEPSAKSSEVADLPKTPKPLNSEVSKTTEAPVSNPEKE